MKRVFLFAAVAALFAACSSNDDIVKEDVKQEPQIEKGAIGFDVYTQKATTRAGWAGSLTTATLKENHATAYAKANGFGIFGYYTDNNEYEQRSVPNFMYNQQVTWKSATPEGWEYTPIVYWPNEYGDKAISDDQDKLTFFAYAPYVKVIPTSGKVANTATLPADNTKELEGYGITGMTKNTTQGDPILKYIASFDNKKSVDLCWGVADNGDGAKWNTVQTGTPQNIIKDGLPWIDLERPAGVNQKVRFTFKHATAQLRVSIDADVDVDGHGHDEKVADKTRIWVREVKFKGFVMKGALNLNNETANEPKWLDYNGQNELVAEDVIIYDGRKDGKEGVAGAVATNEKTLGLNPALIQDGAYVKGDPADDDIYDPDNDVKVYGVDASGAPKTDDAWQRPGVTKNTVNLFRYDYDNQDNKSHTTTMDLTNTSEFFHVIPVNDNFEVEIVYDVETVDANLAQSLSDGAAKGSSIENRISKTITFGNENVLKAGHSYALALHLGMNSVKFDATVSEWIDEAEQDVDLPLNAPQFAAGAVATTIYGDDDPTGDMIYLPYANASVYELALTGMDGGENVKGNVETNKGKANSSTGIVNTKLTWTASTDNALKNGYAIMKVTTDVNPTTSNRSQEVTWTGDQSGHGATFLFTQKAHPLELYVTEADPAAATHNVYNINGASAENQKKFDLGRSAELTNGFGWMCKGLAANCVKVTPTADPYGVPDGAESYIKVWRNGARLNWVGSIAAGGFTFTDAAGTITFNEALQAGDVITITLKTGDAPEETITVKIVDTP